MSGDGAMSRIIPSENWPPYKWVWKRVGGRPWTHIMRDNTKVALPIFIVMFVVTLVFWATRTAKVPLWFLLVYGFIVALAAHVWW